MELRINVHKCTINLSSTDLSVSATLLAIAVCICRSDELVSIPQIGRVSHKAYPGCSVNVELFWVAHWLVTTQANNDKCTCFTMAGCHTVLTPKEKQSGQQLLYACHLPECTCLSGLNISCYPINTSHVQQQFDSSWNKHMKKWGYLLVVADMSYDGKLCLAIIQVPQPTEMHCVHMIVSAESQRENISLLQGLYCNTARWSIHLAKELGFVATKASSK